MSNGTATGHTSILRKLLLTVMIVGASGSTIGAGTFASYNATTSNSAVAFDTGYLVLSNTTPVTNTACFSYGASTSFTNSNSNASCDSVFTTNKTNLKPGDTATSVNFTLQNKGNLAAGSMSLYRSACATATNNGSGFHGAGNPCDALAIMVQETQSDFTTNVKCWYPVVAAGACTMDASANVSDIGVAASPVAVTSASLAVDDIKYYTVTIQLPSTASDNTVQGMQTSFSLTWQLQQ